MCDCDAAKAVKLSELTKGLCERQPIGLGYVTKVTINSDPREPALLELAVIDDEFLREVHSAGIVGKWGATRFGIENQAC